MKKGHLIPMRINLNPPADATAKNESTTFLMIRFAITYSVFLLIILLLMVYLHRVSTTRSEQDFWNQDQSTFESAVSLLDNNFTTMDSITRQLSMNTKLYHLATMKSTDDNDFYLSGLTMKQSLASYMYSYNELPFSTYFVYLRNSGYIISVNTFNSEQLYYIRNYLSSGANFNEWHDLLNNNLTKDSALYPLSDFMLPESGNAYLYVLNMDVLTYKDIPATVAFHINEQTLRKIFSGVSLGDTGYIIAVDAQDQPVFSLSEDKNTSSEKDLNIDGFFRFRMRDFMVYISIISDIAFEEYLIRKDKNQFINTLKFFIESQEQKIDLLIIHIMRNGDFRFYDKYGDEINNKESEEMMSMIMKEDLNLEDCLISVLLSLCPKKVEIIDDLKNETSKEIIENMKIIFEGNVNIVPKK